jgi:hypothetical protein
VLHVALCRPQGDHESGRDLPIAQALRDEFSEFALPWGQRRRGLGRSLIGRWPRRFVPVRRAPVVPRRVSPTRKGVTMRLAARNIPTSLATAAYILHSGVEKWHGGPEQAAGVHGMAWHPACTPSRRSSSQKTFLTMLAAAEIAIGSGATTADRAEQVGRRSVDGVLWRTADDVLANSPAPRATQRLAHPYRDRSQQGRMDARHRPRPARRLAESQLIASRPRISVGRLKAGLLLVVIQHEVEVAAVHPGSGSAAHQMGRWSRARRARRPVTAALRSFPEQGKLS